MKKNKLKEELDRIQLPDDSKNAVLERIRSAGAEKDAPQPVFKKKFPVRRVILIAAAVTVLAALAVGLFVWLRPAEPVAPPVSDGPDFPAPVVIPETSGEDWVKNLFEKSESRENGEGEIRNEASHSGEYDDPAFEGAPAAIGKVDGKSAIEYREDYEPDYGDPAEPEIGPGEHGAVPGSADGPFEEPYRPSGNNPEQISAGMLTAGRRDDNLKFNEFLQEMAGLNTYAPSWQLYPKKRIAVLAENCPNALVALTDAENRVLAYARTNINGKAYLYYDLYTGEGQTVPKKIGISSGDAFGEYTLTGEENGAVSIRLEKAAPASDKLDVLIMLDTTGSMGDEIRYLQKEIDDVMGRVKAETGNARVRLSVNFYRDRGDAYTVRYHPFTEDIAKCKGWLEQEYADGGGDFPEAVDEALVNAVIDHAWDEDAVKVMFLVLDAPPHDESERQGTLSNIRKALESARKQGIRIVPVVASGIDDSTEYLMRSIAAVTGGVYAFLTDHSGIGNAHADPHVDDYTVEKLNDLMVNVVLSYWKAEPAGEPSADPDPVSDEPKTDVGYTITLTGKNAADVTACPESAKEGETVEVRTDILYDADYRVFVDGEEIPKSHYDSDYWGYEFTMPGHDVTVEVTAVSGWKFETSGFEESGGEVILPILPIG